MQKIYKSYRFRIYPDNEQKHCLNVNFGCTRFVYNHYLNEKEDYYKKYNKNLSIKDIQHNLAVDLKDKHKWLRECDSMALQNAIVNLDRAYINFFEGRASKPKPKYKGCKDSYKTSCIRGSYKNSTYANIEVDIKMYLIKLPKMGWVAFKGYRDLVAFPWKIVSVTLSKESNKYYASVLVEDIIDDKPLVITNAIGIDMGIKDEVICADGGKYSKLDTTRVEKCIKGLQKALSRCEKNSHNRYKLKEKVSRGFMKIRNMRKYYIHEITKELTDNNDLIAIETLDIMGMIQEGKGTHLSKHINNASWRHLIETLRYKCKWKGKVLIEIDKYYASSQICNVCGQKNKEVKDLRIN